MKMTLMAAALLFVCGIAIGRAYQPASGKVYEMRTYTAAEGKFDAVNARFRDHTVKLFEKHGMKNVGYWTPSEGRWWGRRWSTSSSTRAATPRGGWGGVRADPDCRRQSGHPKLGGRILAKAPESVFLTRPTLGDQVTAPVA